MAGTRPLWTDWAGPAGCVTRATLRLSGEVRFMRSERGITGLETAIILIAFVVVASVFAFTILSTRHNRFREKQRDGSCGS